MSRANSLCNVKTPLLSSMFTGKMFPGYVICAAVTGARVTTC